MASDNEENPTYSISFRLQRITTESTFVSVPVTDDLIVPHPDGTGRLDVEKVAQRAVEMGQASAVVWQTEEQQVQLHPIQMPPPWAAEQLSSP